MKKMTTILGLVLMSSTVFAGNCVSLDLNEGQERIKAIEGLSQERQSLHFDVLKSAKTTQILACAGMNETLSKEEADFAISELMASKKAKIRGLNEQIEFLTAGLADQNLSEVKRSVYLDSLKLVRQQLQDLQNRPDMAIAKIKQLSR
jgi:hypothetical protein